MTPRRARDGLTAAPRTMQRVTPEEPPPTRPRRSRVTGSAFDRMLRVWRDEYDTARQLAARASATWCGAPSPSRSWIRSRSSWPRGCCRACASTTWPRRSWSRSSRALLTFLLRPVAFLVIRQSIVVTALLTIWFMGVTLMWAQSIVDRRDHRRLALGVRDRVRRGGAEHGAHRAPGTGRGRVVLPQHAQEAGPRPGRRRRPARPGLRHPPDRRSRRAGHPPRAAHRLHALPVRRHPRRHPPPGPLGGARAVDDQLRARRASSTATTRASRPSAGGRRTVAT